MRTQMILPFGQPHLLAIEMMLAATPGSPLGRTRFGLPQKERLVLAAGEIAISDLALLASDSAMRGTTEPGVVLARMFGRSTLVDLPKLDIYWETYGILPGDSLSVAIEVTGLDTPGRLRRIAESVRLVGRTQNSLTISWKLPHAATGALPVPGVIPTLGRVVGLDISTLRPGRYRLTASVSRPGSRTVSTAAEFTLE
jgi:hypothetical protein